LLVFPSSKNGSSLPPASNAVLATDNRKASKVPGPRPPPHHGFRSLREAPVGSPPLPPLIGGGRKRKSRSFVFLADAPAVPEFFAASQFSTCFCPPEKNKGEGRKPPKGPQNPWARINRDGGRTPFSSSLPRFGGGRVPGRGGRASAPFSGAPYRRALASAHFAERLDPGPPLSNAIGSAARAGLPGRPWHRGLSEATSPPPVP